MQRCSYLRSLVGLLLFSVAAFGQSQNATLEGQVTDSTGAFIPQATVTITSVDRQISSNVQTDESGRYSFAALLPGNYDLSAEAKGFKGYIQRNILLAVNQTARIDLSLQVGDAATKVEVTADVTQLNLDNGVKQEGIAPGIINKLPLLVSAGTPRNAVQFISFLPGVNTGTGVQAFNSRINGGLKMGDEAVMDGVSMQEGTMSQSGMVSFFDFPTTPDMVSEVHVLTSSYEPEYGTTTGGEIIVTTRSGTNQYHGGGFEYFRNKDLNALQFTNNRGPGDQRPQDNENQFGGFIGGPVKIPVIPLIWGAKHKTYFFFDAEYLRSLGGATRPLLSIPSAQERTGDFSDLTIPIYDPTTTTISTSGVLSRAQYPGNVIPVSQQSALALQWMKYLPATTSAGPINNFLGQPVSDGILSNLDEYLVKFDHYWGEHDHFFATIWRQYTHPNEQCTLPVQLCTSSPANPEDAWVSRFNWDHIFTPTFLNHWAFGYLNRNEGYGSVSGQNPAELPMIPNAAAYNASPQAGFSGNGVTNYAGWGNYQGLGQLNKSTRPSYITNDLLTWVKGAHTVKFGGEFRHLQEVFRNNNGQSGAVNFNALSTALPGIQSGSPYASILAGAVDSGNLNVYNIAKYGPEQRAYSLFVGDTWKIKHNFTVNYGLRWDQFSPTFETGNHSAFFSFAPNPTAGNLPGSLVYAGNNWGDASAGVRYPETLWHGGIAPRVGFAWSPDQNLVIRAGYGMFYTQAFYPGWNGGISLDGFNPAVSFQDSGGGYVPAFYLDSGFPAYNKAPDVSVGADNGRAPNYRPTDANHLSYAQQWNLTIDRKIGNSGMASIAYVANRGVHLPSQLQPLNALNPNLLSMNTALNAVFAPGQGSLNGVNAPYGAWAQQLLNAGCSPTVAQAMSPYPQYCGGLTGLNENEGTSNYQAFQAKFEKNLSGGIYVGANYTFSKLMTDASSTTQSTANYGAIGSVINPYQGYRNWSLSPDDIANTLSVLGVYDLPFGSGKRFMNHSGFMNYIFGGWNVATSMKFTSGMPTYFRDQSVCGLPSQFQAQCIPGIVSNNVLLQSFSGINVNKPLYNVAAFEPSSNFDGFFLGSGSRVTPIRGSGYKDVNLTIAKQFAIKERVNLEIRAEMFNVLNNHYFTCDGQAFGDCIPFNNDPSSSAFGSWNGTVSQPRNIQLVGRITF
jgi:hypothetical protein